MHDPIFVTQPFMPPLEEFNEYLKKIWGTKILTNNGQFHQELEKALCDYLGVKFISLFSNGTLALITALKALEIKGEVITTPFSFVATTHAIWWNNLKPVFVDIDPETLNIDPEKVEAAITPITTAIMPVHVYGSPCNSERLKQVADKHGLKLIYDAAHAFGVSLNGHSVLNYGNLSVLSFHATKSFSTMEGGAIVCHDEGTKQQIDNLKNFGIVDEVTVVKPGINAKMNELQAAFGLLQLKYINTAVSKREKIAHIYREKLSAVTGIKLLEEVSGVKNFYTYFTLLVDEKNYGISRDELYNYLKNNNIYTRRYFYPLISNFPFYRDLPSSKAENLPVANLISRQVLCLPIYPDLPVEIVLEICDLIKNTKI
jgi:dTDP-4-amino-4,6-dideoxygalactose transaminase